MDSDEDEFGAHIIDDFPVEQGAPLLPPAQLAFQNAPLTVRPTLLSPHTFLCASRC